MLKLILYIILTGSGVIAALINPLYGAIACLQAYLLNPSIVVGTELRAQLLTSITFLIGYAIHGRHRSPHRGALGPLIMLWVFVGIGLLSAVWAVFSAEQAVYAIYEVFKTVLMISVLVAVVRSEADMKMIMIACMLGAWHAAFVHTFGIKWGYVGSSYGRDIGVLPDGQTAVMVLFLPTLVVVAVLGRGRIERLVAWCALPFVLNSIVSSYTRTGFVSLAVEAIALAILLPRRIALRLLPVVTVGAALFFFRLTPDDYWERVRTIQAPREEASANSRFVINSASMRMLADYPFGVGYRNYPDVSPRYLPPELLTEGRRSAHNSYFSVLCETGIPGFLIWITAFLGTLWQLRRIRKTADPKNLTAVVTYALGIEIGLLGWMAGGCFQADHEVDPAYWFVAFAVVLTRLHAHYRQAAPSAPVEPADEEQTLAPIR